MLVHTMKSVLQQIFFLLLHNRWIIFKKAHAKNFFNLSLDNFLLMNGS